MKELQRNDKNAGLLAISTEYKIPSPSPAIGIITHGIIVHIIVLLVVQGNRFVVQFTHLLRQHSTGMTVLDGS